MHNLIMCCKLRLRRPFFGGSRSEGSVRGRPSRSSKTSVAVTTWTNSASVALPPPPTQNCTPPSHAFNFSNPHSDHNSVFPTLLPSFISQSSVMEAHTLEARLEKITLHNDQNEDPKSPSQLSYHKSKVRRLAFHEPDFLKLTLSGLRVYCNLNFWTGPTWTEHKQCQSHEDASAEASIVKCCQERQCDNHQSHSAFSDNSKGTHLNHHHPHL